MKFVANEQPNWPNLAARNHPPDDATSRFLIMHAMKKIQIMCNEDNLCGLARQHS